MAAAFLAHVNGASIQQVENGAENDWAVLKRYYIDTSTFHNQIDQWNDNARQAFLDPVFLRQLFVEKSNFIRDCNPAGRRQRLKTCSNIHTKGLSL